MAVQHSWGDFSLAALFWGSIKSAWFICLFLSWNAPQEYNSWSLLTLNSGAILVLDLDLSDDCLSDRDLSQPLGVWDMYPAWLLDQGVLAPHLISRKPVAQKTCPVSYDPGHTPPRCCSHPIPIILTNKSQIRTRHGPDRNCHFFHLHCEFAMPMTKCLGCDVSGSLSE